MRKLIILVISVIIVFQGALALSKPDAKADHILEQMHEKAKKINTVQASIVQRKHFGDTGNNLQNSGYMYFKHEGPNKDKIRITYKSGGDVTQDLLIDGDKITLYQPKIKQALITTRSKQAQQNPEYDFLAAPYGSVPGLKNRYDTVYIGDETDPKHGPTGTAVIQLTPKVKSSFKTVTFWVDQSSWMPIQYRVDEPYGDFTVLTLSDIKKNGDVPANAFNLVLPKGTTRINQ